MCRRAIRFGTLSGGRKTPLWRGSERCWGEDIRRLGSIGCPAALSTRVVGWLAEFSPRSVPVCRRTSDWTGQANSYTLGLMSKPKSPGVDEPVAGSNVSFEEALKRLESIVEAMENADLPLETLLARFEQGAQLVQLCQA